MLGEAQQLAHPLAHDLLDDGRRRAADVEPGILIPRRREPVRREGGGQPAADDEAEVPPARHRDETGVGGGDELLHDLRRLERRILERHAQDSAQFVDGCAREDGPMLERVQEVRGELRRAPEQCARVVHESDSTRLMIRRAASASISPAS